MWFKVDDRFHSHPKVHIMGNSAIGLWTRLGSYCGQALTDGFVPTSVVRNYGSSRDISRLLLAGMIERGEHPTYGPGYYLHDYLDYNPSRAQVLADRAVNAERQRRWKEKHGAKDQPELWPEPDSGNGVTNAAPTRPVPLSSTSVERLTTTDTPGESSSSVDELVKVTAAGIALGTGHAAQGSYARGVERNLRAERMAELEELAGSGDRLGAVASLVGSKVHARAAFRALNLSTNGDHP